MKAILEFSLPEEKLEFEDAVRAGAYAAAISEIGNQVFRPARKHGYSDPELRALVEETPNAVEIISRLEKMFYDILEEYKANESY